jgi:outer membrane protein assembly factor BamB
LIWHAADDEAGYSSPALTGGGDLLCWMRNHLWVLDPASGAVRAKRHLRSRMDASVTTAQPLDLGDGTLLLTAEYGVGLHQLALPDLKQVWTAQRLLDCQYSTPLRRDRLLFGFHGMQGARQTLRCVDLDKRESLWLSPAVPGGHVVRTDDHLIAVTEQGEVWVQPLAAQAFDPEQQAQIMRAGHRSPPALSGGVLFARDADQLLAWRLFKMEGG